jgi:hypothetical protein
LNGCAQQMIAAYYRVRDEAEPYIAALVEERRRDPRDLRCSARRSCATERRRR